jgi:hypothetical protein
MTKINYLELLRASKGTLSRRSRLHLQSLAPTKRHWARVMGYSLFSLCVIHKEGLCPSSGDINRLLMMKGSCTDWILLTFCLSLFQKFGKTFSDNKLSRFQYCFKGIKTLNEIYKVLYITTQYLQKNKHVFEFVSMGYSDRKYFFVLITNGDNDIYLEAILFSKRNCISIFHRALNVNKIFIIIYLDS